jgi:hypothetical protein
MFDSQEFFTGASLIVIVIREFRCGGVRVSLLKEGYDMRHILLISAAALAVAGCNKADQAAANAEAEAPAANEVATPAPASMSLNETTWTFTREGKDITESIDANGNYIANAGAEHVDHGTYVAKDGKACFTSAMTDEGEVCWTVVDTPIGQTAETTSDKGEKLMVTRVEYKPLTM